MWSELPSELLQLIAEKHTNYVDYLCTRAVCKSWQAAITKKPPNVLCHLPLLLLPYHQNNPDHRGFYNIPDDKTYSIELPGIYKKRCCGSSHGWLIMVEDSPAIFLLNPLTRARIELPSLSSVPTFPTEVVFENSTNLNVNFIRREKLHVRDTFVIKSTISADPSLTANFFVAIIYGFKENLAFCRSGDVDWTLIDEELQPARCKDIMFYAGKFYVVNQMGRISVCNMADTATMVHLADPPQISPRMGYKQWYLACLNEELLLVARYRKLIHDDYEYITDRFDVYELDANGTSWLKLENLSDQILFLGWNSPLSISAKNYTNCKGNCIYFTDDYMRTCRDYVWEGHDFGIFDLEDGSVRSLGLPLYPTKQPCFINIFYDKRTLFRNRSLFILPPPVWVTISP